MNMSASVQTGRARYAIYPKLENAHAARSVPRRSYSYGLLDFQSIISWSTIDLIWKPRLLDSPPEEPEFGPDGPARDANQVPRA